LQLGGDGFAPRLREVLGQPAVDPPTVDVTFGGPLVALPARWQSVQRLDADVAASSLAPQHYDVVVTNPDGAAATLPRALTVDPAPRIDAVAPGMICASGGTLTLTGAGFLDGDSASLVDPQTGMRSTATTTTVTSPTKLDAHFGANNFAGNATLDVVVDNPDGCSATLAGAVKRKVGGGNCP
jgi:hypothetical protein